MQLLLKTHLGCLKAYIQNNLKMHDVPTVEVERRKKKLIEVKFEGFQSRNEKSYSRRNIPQMTNIDKDKYIPPHILDDKRSLEA